MTTTAFPPGIYRISVAPRVGHVESDGVSVEPDGVSVEPDSVERQYLTNGEHYVTIRSPNAHPDLSQEWLVEHDEHSNIIISRPSNKFPSPYLIYDHVSTKPEPGNRVKVQVSDFPLNKWHLQVVHGHGHRYFINVAGSDLGISIAPPKISPPFLDLRRERKLEWVFDFVRHK